MLFTKRAQLVCRGNRCRALVVAIETSPRARNTLSALSAAEEVKKERGRERGQKTKTGSLHFKNKVCHVARLTFSFLVE